MSAGKDIIPHLFRTEYSKITAVLCKAFGIEHIETAEDIVSDTFLLAAETWGQKGIPPNPTAWLYTVSKNKTLDYLKRHRIFSNKITAQLKSEKEIFYEPEIDLSVQNIKDSQLQMMFAICHPCIPPEAQIGLSLSILCGFGVEEIADAFLSTRESIYKRLSRAKEKLRSEKVPIGMPSQGEIGARLETVLTTLYLLFNEGYYSVSQNTTLRKELCAEAMRLNYLLTQNESTNKPAVNALLALMCFHVSRFEARTNANGELVLYGEQDTGLWDKEMIRRGELYLNYASEGNELTKYHLEAAIAYWHTQKTDSGEKWEAILQLYNKLLQVEYSPMAALNRTYALSKSAGKQRAIEEAEKLMLNENHLYHCLLGDLYKGVNNEKALSHFRQAVALARSQPEKTAIQKAMEQVGT